MACRVATSSTPAATSRPPSPSAGSRRRVRRVDDENLSSQPTLRPRLRAPAGPIPARYRTGGDRPAWHAPAPAGGGPFRVRQGGGLVCCDEAGSRPGSWRPVLPARHQALRFFSATVAGAASGEPLDERPHSVQSSTTVRERVFHVKHVRRRPTVCPAAFHVKHDQPRALLRPVADPISGETVTLKPGMVRAPNGSRVPVEEP